MEYESFTEEIDTILKLAIREKDLATALKCAELKFKREQSQQNQHKNCSRPMKVEDLSEEQIISMINNFEGAQA